MKKFLSFIFILIIIPFISIHTYAASQPNLNISSKASILIDGQTGQVIYEQNPNLRLYPASTTKIITAVLGIENGNMNQLMTASKAAVNEIGINGSNIGLASGETAPLEDILNSMLIKSANDCANIIAENISPSRHDFIDLMNTRATELGATNTTFTNTCGLDKSDGHPNHMTTVSDMSKIARYAMTLPKFREIVVKQKYTMPDTNKHPSTYWPKDYIGTTNKFLLGFNKYKSDEFNYTGIKTGYTNLAGCNIIASAKNTDGMELIAVVYGAKEQETLYSDTKRLFEYGFNSYSVKTLVTADDIATKVSVSNSQEPETTLDVKYEETYKTVLPNDYDQSNLTKNLIIRKDLSAPMSQGELVGRVEFFKDDLLLGKVNLIAASSVAAASPAIILLPKSAAGLINSNNIAVGAILILLFVFCYKYFLKKVPHKSQCKKRKPSEN